MIPENDRSPGERSAPGGDVRRLEKLLLGDMARASKDFGLIEPNDRIMVGISGGKDSYDAAPPAAAGAEARRAFRFSIVAVNLDQGHPGFPGHVIRDYLEAEGHEYRMVQRDTYSIVTEKIRRGKTYCSLCSRLRRGILYDVGGRARLHQDRARPPPRRRHRDADAQPALLRAAQGDAAEAALRRRPQHRHPPAGLLRRGGHRRLRRGDEVSRSSPAISAARRRTCSASR